MRSFVHYAFAVTVLSFYGGRVCPLIDDLSFFTWVPFLITLFSALFALRWVLHRRFISHASAHVRTRGALALDLALFAVAAAFTTLFNMKVHRFPLISGMRVTSGIMALGFFAAVDAALEEEWNLLKESVASGMDLHSREKVVPLTGKFSIVVSIIVLLILVISYLLLARELLWLDEIPDVGVKDLPGRIAPELVVLGLVVMAEIFNLMASFSRNLRFQFGHHSGALVAVAGGDLAGKVPVGTNDEFGLMARYTNLMIQSLKKRTHDLLMTQDATIISMTTLAEVRDNETGMHILRTQRYVRVLAMASRKIPKYGAAFDDGMVEMLFKSAPLHDIGKVGIPDVILHKPGKHTDEEFEIMKKHAEYGRDALRNTEKHLESNSFLRLACEIAGSHHEKWDGSGYPDKLKGDEIPLSARLMAIADVYDALISKRVYKPAFTHEVATKIIMEGKGVHFDPELVEIFQGLEGQFKEIAAKYRDG